MTLPSSLVITLFNVALKVPSVSPTFRGSTDGVLRSYSAEAGTILWEYPTQRDFETVNGVRGFGGGIGGGAPAIVDGMMFIVSGYAILGGAPGNVLSAFGLN